jgi:pimeloyl-ACP methyl ester carboxylesterase
MYRTTHVLFAFCVILALPCKVNIPDALAAYTPKTVSKLVADVDLDGQNPSVIGRIPLILIHGVHGTDSSAFSAIDGSTAGERAYFQNFINYFYNSDLKNKYKLYRFHYLSDQLSVKDIGQGLKEWLDEFIRTGGISDGKYVIIAHSMGGLVARSYMQEQQHTYGKYNGQNGGERIEKLITLATPHHGSPGANGASRNALMTDALLWQGVVELASIYYNAQYSIATAISDSVANRSDLRTDSFAFDNGSVIMNDNAWLSSLNQNTIYDGKIKAYYSSIDLSDTERTTVYNQVMTTSPLYLVNYGKSGGNHEKLIVANIILNEGLSAHFPFNDGMVPEDSAKYAGHSVASSVKMFNYDHEQMKDGVSSNPNELFIQLNGDLETNYTSNNTGTINAAEYFIDNDPGEGHGTAIPPKDGLFNTTTEDIQFTPDTSSLTIGVHNLYVRMQNSAGVWGTPRKIPFEITGEKYLAAAEYFIDSDPGEGKGTPIQPLDGVFDSSTETFSPQFNTASLSTGMHTLYFRAKNSENHWGLPHAHLFEVMQPPILSSAEYYLDSDPGPGNGIALSATDGSFNSPIEGLQGALNTNLLGYGNHKLYVRAKDSYQRWGTTQNLTFLNGYLLNVNKSGTGTGTITSDDIPQGIVCGSDCSEIYNGQTITLTAAADPGSTFINWNGCTSVSGNTCSVLMTADKNVTAIINDNTPPETTIISKPLPITADSNASFSFTSSEPASTFECRLDGTPFSTCTSPSTYSGLTVGEHTFEVRAKDAAGNQDPIAASYTWERGFGLQVYFQGLGGGTVTSIPAGLSCTEDCSYAFSPGNVTLIGTPDINSYFSGWSNGACSGTGNCTFTMSSDTSITATFSKHPPLKINTLPDMYFSKFLDAYTAVKVNGTIIQGRIEELAEIVNFDRDVEFLFKGGYDGIFSNAVGFTTLKGILNVTNGSLTVENLIIK